MLTVAFAFSLGAVPCATIQAQTGGRYDLTWNTVDGGSISSATGGGYSLGGTIGQPEAGAAVGGGYSLTGGFWYDGAYRAFVPVVLRGN
jgi:hypothetical protein